MSNYKLNWPAIQSAVEHKTGYTPSKPDISGELGVHINTLQGWTNYEVPAAVNQMVRLSHLTGLPINELLIHANK